LRCNFTLLILFDILVSPAREGLALSHASHSQSTRHFQLELLVALHFELIHVQPEEAPPVSNFFVNALGLPIGFSLLNPGF
jgi:hypothetical protein